MRKYLFTVAFFCWMVLITVLFLVVFKDVPAIGFKIPHSDKIVHFAFHAVAALLGCHFLREWSSGSLSINRAILIMLGSLLVYGIIIEVLQSTFTTTRVGEVYDVLANMGGALSGAAVVKLLYGGKGQLKW